MPTFIVLRENAHPYDVIAIGVVIAQHRRTHEQVAHLGLQLVVTRAIRDYLLLVPGFQRRVASFSAIRTCPVVRAAGSAGTALDGTDVPCAKFPVRATRD